MKYILAITLFLFSISSSYANIDDDLDYNFINNAFSDPNPTTNQDFEKVMKELEKPKEGFFTKMYKFFDKDKVKYDEAFKTKYANPNNQPKRIKDVADEKPTVLISINATDYLGHKIPPGYYQVNFKKTDESSYILELSQGTIKNIATIIAHKTDEDENSESIIYSKAITLDNGYIKIVYANLDLTLLGYLKVIKEEEPVLETLY